MISSTLLFITACSTYVNLTITTPDNTGDTIQFTDNSQIIVYGLRKESSPSKPEIRYISTCPRFVLPETPIFPRVPVDELRKADQNGKGGKAEIMLKYLTAMKTEHNKYFSKLNSSYDNYSKKCK